jgi:hypothetical protein
MFDSSSVITLFPTIMSGLNSKLFVVVVLAFVLVSYYGHYYKTLSSNWDWRLFRATSKYELQSLNRGLYVLTNSPEWKRLAPKLTAIRVATHQIERIQILVSTVRNGVVFKGIDNIPGRRFITRIDTDSHNSVYVKVKNASIESRVTLNKDLFLSYSPSINNQVCVKSDAARNRITVLLIIDTVR